MINSFIDFAKTGKIHKNNQLLNEDLVSLQQQFFNKKSIGFLLWAASYSPDWNDAMQYTNLKLEFETTDKRDNFFQTAKRLYTANSVDFDQMFSIDTSSSNAPAQKTLTVTYPEKQFGMLAKALKQKGLKFVPKRNGDTIAFSGDDDTLKNIYIVWKVLDAGDDPAKVSLLQSGQDLPDTVKDDYASKVQQQSMQSTVVQAKTFNLALHLFLMYRLYITDSTKELTFDCGLPTGTAANLCSYSSQPVVETDILHTANEVEAFKKSVSVLPAVSETMRFVVSMIYNEVEKNGVQQSSLAKDLTEYNIAYKLTQFKLRAAKTNNTNDSDEDKAIREKYTSALKNIMKVKTFKEFKDIVASTEVTVDSDIDASQSLQDEKSQLYTNVTNPCAHRRLKLFKDVLSIDTNKPAKVIKNNKWIFAITYTRNQNGVWGRNKPKTDNNNNILVECNLTDQEHITERNKQIRDSKTYNWIRDGINDKADSHFKESNWCTTGGIGDSNCPWSRNNDVGYWSSYNGGGKYPYIQMMELATGMMYQLGWNGENYTGFLFESEYESNIGLIQAYSDTAGNLQRARAQDPAFDQLMKEVDKVYGSMDEIEINNIISQLRSKGNITNNSRLILKNIYDIEIFRQKLYKFANRFTGIVIQYKNCYEAFCDLTFSVGAPTIDLIGVKNAGSMFKNAKIETLHLINTSGIDNMEMMFYEANITSINGLDTSGATTIESMFERIRNYKGKVLQVSVNALDLRNCTNMNRAFNDTGFRKITLMNTDKIKSATNAYQKCWLLENYPVAEFKNVKDLKNLYSESTSISDSLKYAKDFGQLFAFCPKLQHKTDFNEFCERLYKFYVGKGIKFENKAEVDERGFLVIKSPNDVQLNINNFNKYPGVVVKMSDASYLFEGHKINIETLDLNDVKTADYMFKNAVIKQLNAVINSDGIRTAKHMFEQCSFAALPQLSMKGLSGNLTLFYNAKKPKDLPIVSFSTAIKLPTLNNNSDIDNFLFILLGDKYASTYGYGGWVNNWQPELLRKWVKHLCKDNIEELKKEIESGIKTDENGYIIINSVNILLALLNANNGKVQDYFDSVKGFTINISDAAALFSNDSVRRFIYDTKLPKLNLAAVQTADSMFTDVRCTLTALENCRQIKSADNMFCGANIDNFPEDVDFSGVVNGTRMFYNARIKFSNSNSNIFKLRDFKSLELATEMFTNCKTYNGQYLIFNIDQLDIRNVKQANGMFSNTQIAQMTYLNLPHLEIAQKMFCRAKFLSTSAKIKEINLPVATNVVAMFKEAHLSINGGNQWQINKISAPRATIASAMFHSSNITKIGTLDLRNAITATDIFSYASYMNMLLRPIFTVTNINLTNAFKRCPLNAIFQMNGQRLLARIRARANRAVTDNNQAPM